MRIVTVGENMKTFVIVDLFTLVRPLRWRVRKVRGSSGG